MRSEIELYSEIENLIISWSNDGTKTAGSLTRKIMSLMQTKSEQVSKITYLQIIDDQEEEISSLKLKVEALQQKLEENGNTR